MKWEMGISGLPSASAGETVAMGEARAASEAVAAGEARAAGGAGQVKRRERRFTEVAATSAALPQRAGRPLA